MRYYFSKLERLEKERDHAQENFEKAQDEMHLFVYSGDKGEKPHAASWGIHMDPTVSNNDDEDLLRVEIRGGKDMYVKDYFFLPLKQAQEIQEYLEDWCNHVRNKQRGVAETKHRLEVRERHTKLIKEKKDGKEK